MYSGTTTIFRSLEEHAVSATTQYTLDLLKMNLISARTNDRPAMVSRDSEIVGALEPVLAYTIQCQQIVGNLSQTVVVQSNLLASYLLVLATRAIIESGIFLLNTAQTLKSATNAIWESQQVRRLRKKLELEFFTFILGGGNSIFLIFFWPGWWLLAIMILTACSSYIGWP